ncbi:unnamed protein product [Nippostrongylus brasiliensis]|uniref:Transposase n=1 Tax=Nippostrongylus brasiliensis TaxID=27835 RepID=A0A0N4YCQ7_NIPBR|nr:unnamed protein product [Nippostrongylus brasiliensis]
MTVMVIEPASAHVLSILPCQLRKHNASTVIDVVLVHGVYRSDWLDMLQLPQPGSFSSFPSAFAAFASQLQSPHFQNADYAMPRKRVGGSTMKTAKVSCCCYETLKNWFPRCRQRSR